MHTFVANFLRYVPSKNYWNWIILSQVFAKVKRVTFFWDKKDSVVFVFGCQYQCNWLSGKSRPQNDLLCVEWDVKPYTLTHDCVLGESVCDDMLPGWRWWWAEFPGACRAWWVGLVLRECVDTVGSTTAAGHHWLPLYHRIHRQPFNSHLPLHSQQVRTAPFYADICVDFSVALE